MWRLDQSQCGYMTRLGIRELRDHLSRYLERVQAGEEVVVTDRTPSQQWAEGDGRKNRRVSPALDALGVKG